jgi:CDP-diacylglycerol--glycerol-3-phosphate 3-phosphatidyltransferase
MAMVILMILNLEIPAVQMLTMIIMYVACALTIISLVDYIVKNKQVLASQK